MKTEYLTLRQLRRLLHDLSAKRPDIGVRFRLIGEMWQTDHLNIIQLNDKGVALHDDKNDKFVFIPDLADVMEFDLDQPFQQYQPHYHYRVDPALVV